MNKYIHNSTKKSGANIHVFLYIGLVKKYFFDNKEDKYHILKLIRVRIVSCCCTCMC